MYLLINYYYFLYIKDMETEDKKEGKEKKEEKEKKAEKKEEKNEEKKEGMQEMNKKEYTIKELQQTLNEFISLNKDGKLKILGKVFKILHYIYEKEYYYLVHSISLPNLVELYIESSLDENKNDEFKYYEIFKELKNYCFIPREYIISIYQYFSDIYHRKKIIAEKDKKFLKFPKVVMLWEIFYKMDSKINTHISNIISGGKPLKVDHKKVKQIIVMFYSSIIKELNEKFLFLEIIFKNNKCLTYSYKDYLEDYKEDIKGLCTIKFSQEAIKIFFDGKEKEEKNILNDSEKIKEITQINILNKFYGEIIGIIYYKDKKTPEHKFNDELKLKYATNFINYNSKEFNIYDYFNGLKPFIPFPLLIKDLFENDNIKVIGGKSKNDFLKEFVKKIFDVLIDICDYYNKRDPTNSEKKSVKKIANFIIPLFFEIDFELLPELDHKKLENKNDVLADKKEKEKKKEDKKQNEKILSLFFSKYNLHYLKKIMVEYYKEKKRKSIFLQEIEKVKFEDEEEEKLLKGFDYKRLYEHYMKELFIYNGYWSKKEYFFKEKAKIEENEGDKKINENKIIINNNDDDNDSKLKYKQLSYYTRNYQQPILYPILQYDKYIPNI